MDSLATLATGLVLTREFAGKVAVTDNSDALIERVAFTFENGYTASFVRGKPGTVMEQLMPPEGAVMDEDGLNYSTPVTSDVVRFGEVEELVEFARAVEALPPKAVKELRSRQ